jgi:hypothetical protein
MENNESEDNENEYDGDIAGGEFTMPLKFAAGLEYQITPVFALQSSIRTDLLKLSNLMLIVLKQMII